MTDKTIFGSNVFELNPATVKALLEEGLNARLAASAAVRVTSYVAQPGSPPTLRVYVEPAETD